MMLKSKLSVGVLGGMLGFSVIAGESLVIDGSNVDTVTRRELEAALVADGRVEVKANFVLPSLRIHPGAEIAIDPGVTLTLGSGKELSIAEGAYGSVKLSIADGAVFRLADASAHPNVAFDLAITGTGKVQFTYDVDDKYDPGVLIARTITVGGEVLTGRRYYGSGSSKSAWIDGMGGSAAVFRPWVWTGKGSDSNWETAANWEGESVPDNSLNGVADISPAAISGQTITFAGARVIGCLVNFAPKSTPLAMLKSDYNITLSAYANLRTCALIAKDREIRIDANTYQGGSYKVLAAGGGRFSHRGNGLQDGNTSYIAVDGKYVVDQVVNNGTGTFGCLAWYAPTETEMRIEDGGELTAGEILFSFPGSAFLDNMRITQNGGTVGLSTGLYVGKYRDSNLANVPVYRLNGGTLTAPVVAAGWKSPAIGALCKSNGRFEMRGGELTAEEIGCGVYGFSVHLLGGTVNLGKGGITLDDQDISGSGAYGSGDRFNFGAVTIKATEPLVCGKKAHTAMPLTTQPMIFRFKGIGGNTVFDTTGGEIEIDSSVELLSENTGGFVKRGVMPMTLSCKVNLSAAAVQVDEGALICSGTSKVGAQEDGTTFSVAEGASLSLLGEVGPYLALEVKSLDQLTLNKDITVVALTLDGVGQIAGSYAAGDYTVTVDPSKSQRNAWIGVDGSNWGENSSWSSGRIPKSGDDLSFGIFRLNSAATIDLHSGGTWANHYQYARGSGDAFSILRGDAGEYFVFGGSGRSLSVGAENTFVFACGLWIRGVENYKYGNGTLSVDGPFRSVDNTLQDGQSYNWLIGGGEMVFNGTIQGVRVMTCSSDPANVPRLTLNSSAAGGRGMTEFGYAVENGQADAYGEIVMHDGSVNLIAREGSDEFALMNCTGGRQDFEMQNGTFSFPAVAGGMYVNGNRTDAAAHNFRFAQTGGTVVWPRLRLGYGDDERDVFTVSNGVFALTDEISVEGHGDVRFELAGGTLRLDSAAAKIIGANLDLTVDSYVRVQDDVNVSLETVVLGNAEFKKVGTGRLLMGDAGLASFSGSLLVREGSFGFNGTSTTSAMTLSIHKNALVDVGTDHVTVKRLVINGRARPAGTYLPGAPGFRYAKNIVGNGGTLTVLEGEPEPGLSIILR